MTRAPLFLVEDFDPSQRLPGGATIIGLTPQSCWDLERAGVGYSVLEDYCDTAALVAEAPLFHQRLRAWIDELDNSIATRPVQGAAECRPALAYYAHLKPAIGSLAIKARQLTDVVRTVRPSTLTYVERSGAVDGVSNSLSFRHTRSISSRLAPAVAAQAGIPFTSSILPAAAAAARNVTPPGLRLRSFLASNPLTARLYNDWNSVRRTQRPGRGGGARLLFLHLNRYLREMLFESLRSGHTVFYQAGGRIIRQNAGWSKTVRRVPDTGARSSPAEPERAAAHLRRLSDLCGLDIGSAFETRLRHLLDYVAPAIANGAARYVELFQSLRLDGIVMSNRVSTGDYAAVEATRLSPGTAAVYINHGDDVFDQRWRETLVDQFDVYCESTREQVAFLNARPLSRARVVEQGRRLRMTPTRAAFPSPRAVLLYVPMMFVWDDTAWNEAMAPDTWYFRWQRRLLDYFVSRDDYEVVWKALPSSGSTPDPMPAAIAASGASHVRYATEWFGDWIPRAERVLLDFPSTALYEAAAAGLPVRSLYFDPFFKIRDGARGVFGGSLVPFTSFDDGIAKTAEFLDGNGDQFRVRLDPLDVPGDRIADLVLTRRAVV